VLSDANAIAVFETTGSEKQIGSVKKDHAAVLSSYLDFPMFPPLIFLVQADQESSHRKEESQDGIDATLFTDCTMEKAVVLCEQLSSLHPTISE